MLTECSCYRGRNNYKYYDDAFSTSAVFGPEGADSLKIEDKPRVFGSVSQNRVWLENHGGYSSRIRCLMILMVESQTNLITF